MTKSQILKSLLLYVGLTSIGQSSHALSGTKLRADYVAGNPIQSMVIVSSVGNGTQMCGGLLISRKHVLTAYHCVNVENDSQVRIFFPKKDSAASTNSTGWWAEENRQARVIYQPDGNKVLSGTNIPFGINDNNVGARVFDVAVIELAEDAPSEVPEFSYKNLATNEDLRSGQVSAFGWETEKFSYNGSYYKNLYRREDRQARLADKDLMRQFFSSELETYCLRSEISPNGACANSTLMQKLYGLNVSNYKIAVSTPNNICEGDSGSPLFVRTASGYKLVGVTSSGFALNGRIVANTWVGDKKCSPHSFYQTIAPLKNWIQSIVR